MALSAFDIQKNSSDTTDAGIDLIVDGISSPAGSASVTKLANGAAGSISLITDANPLQVEIFDVSGTMAADIAAIKTAVEIIDNAISGSEMQVDLVSAAVTNAGTFAVQISDTSFAVADGNALGEGVLVQGDDGTNRKNINVDATTGDVQVDVTNTVTVDGSGVTQPVSGTVTANLGATDNAVLDSIVTNTTGLDGTVSGNELQVDVVAALPAGTNAIGKLAANSGVDIGDVDVTSIAAGSNLIGDVGLQGRTSGGLTMHKTTSAASTNATSVKASAGQVYSIQCFNVNAAVRYLKLYNKASAPTVGTDTPVKTLAIPGDTAGAGFIYAIPQGLEFTTGIAFALTTEATDAGTTGVAANEITVNMDYE